MFALHLTFVLNITFNLHICITFYIRITYYFSFTNLYKICFRAIQAEHFNVESQLVMSLIVGAMAGLSGALLHLEKDVICSVNLVSMSTCQIKEYSTGSKIGLRYYDTKVSTQNDYVYHAKY